MSVPEKKAEALVLGVGISTKVTEWPPRFQETTSDGYAPAVEVDNSPPSSPSCEDWVILGRRLKKQAIQPPTPSPVIEENVCYWVFTTRNADLTVENFTKEYLRLLREGMLPPGLTAGKHPNETNFFPNEELLQNGLKNLAGDEEKRIGLLIVCKVESPSAFKSIFTGTPQAGNIPISIYGIYDISAERVPIKRLSSADVAPPASEPVAASSRKFR